MSEAKGRKNLPFGIIGRGEVRFAQELSEGQLGNACPLACPACFGALQENAVPLPEFFGPLRRENCPQIAMFIGPEGDFSASEVAALLAAGARPVTFGPIVLRVETAALFILSALQYAWL